MSVPFYLDHNVPAAVAEGLRLRGIEVLTAEEDGRAAAADEQLLARARELGRVFFTHDTDFLRIATEQQRDQRDFSGVVWCHQESLSIGRLIDQLELLSQLAEPKEFDQRVMYLPL